MAFNTWTESDVLYASDLNENFTLITAALHSITGGQIAPDAINAGTLIADDIVDETHMNYADTVIGAGVLQIGKDRSTHGQMMVKGTTLITAAATTNTSVTVTYANADCVTGGEPVYTAAPHVFCSVYSDLGTDGGLNMLACGTDSFSVNIDMPGALTITEDWTVYWMAVGNV